MKEQWSKIFLLIVLLIVSITISHAQQLGFRMREGEKKIKIPFELHNNLVIIPVILNKKLPLKFVLDTGVRTTILVDKNFSDLLNLEYTKRYTLSGVGGEKIVDAYIANSISLTLPGIHGEGHAMLVLEKDLLELRNYLGTEVHGILGYELFSRFVIEINYANKMLTIIEPEYFSPRKSYDAIPMTIEDTKPHIYAKLHQDDSTEVVVKLMVDSGASQSFFIEHESDSLRLKLPDKYLYTNIGRGLGGAIKGYVGRLPAVEIGSYRLEDVIVNYPESSSYIDSVKYQRTDRDGTLGGEVLSRFNIIFSFPEEIFYLKRNSAFKKDFTYNLSGLTVRAIGPELDYFEITEVRENSAGEEAGVMAGDTILMINNHQSKDLKLQNVIGLLNSAPNKRIRLVIKRKDEVLFTDFRLKNLI